MIKEHSRYTNTLRYERDGRVVLKSREIKDYSEGIVHQFRQGDTLDNLAYQYYGTPKYWWVILQANNYRLEEDIKYGDFVNIPPKEEVLIHPQLFFS